MFFREQRYSLVTFAAQAFALGEAGNRKSSASADGTSTILMSWISAPGIEVGTGISFFVAMIRTTNKTVARNGHRNNDRNNVPNSDPNIVWFISLACGFVKIFSSEPRNRTAPLAKPRRTNVREMTIGPATCVTFSRVERLSG